MSFKLFPFQQELLDEHYQPSMALFLDMGVGKTYVSTGAFLRSGKSKLLIICLTTKINDWAEVISMATDLDVVTLNKGTARNNKIIGDQVNIISFESSWRLDEALLKFVDNDTYIIIDESHKIKNRSSKVGIFARKLGERTKYKAILTGTPQNNGYQDYYNQYHFLGHMRMSWKAFENQYCIITHQYYNGFPVKEISDYKNTDELDEIINNNAVYYSRDSPYVPSESLVKFEKPKVYDTIKRDRVYVKKDGDIEIYDSKGSLYMALRQLAGGYISGEQVDDQKIRWVKDFVESYDKRIVIFYNFNHERDSLLEALKGYHVSEYSGRIKNLDSFKKYEDGIVLANYAAASTGINDLVISSMMVMYSLPPSYIDYVQAKKRIDRIGQENTPMYYYLVAKGTVEMGIKNSLENGIDFDDQLFDKYLEGLA